MILKSSVHKLIEPDFLSTYKFSCKNHVVIFHSNVNFIFFILLFKNWLYFIKIWNLKIPKKLFLEASIYLLQCQQSMFHVLKSKTLSLKECIMQSEFLAETFSKIFKIMYYSLLILFKCCKSFKIIQNLVNFFQFNDRQNDRQKKSLIRAYNIVVSQDPR